MIAKRIRWVFVGLILVLFVGAAGGAEKPAGSGKPANWGPLREVSFEQLKAGFEQPDMIYAPFMFWFWDAPLDVKQAADMAEEMARRRMNPGYAHPRNGLPHEEWLSPKWFESLDAALKKAEAAKMYLGYCDEYWWPSGRADGRVLKSHPELKPVSLKWEIIDVNGQQDVNVPESFFAVAAQLADTPAVIKSETLKVIGAGGPFKWQSPKGLWRIYVFSRYQHPGIDGGDVNYLNRELMKIFIEIAHEPYAEYFGQRMGKSIPGVFVDHEGDYGYKLAWSDDFASEYEKSKGRDIRLWMPLLIDEDVEGLWAKARWDWYDTVSDVYTDNFLGGISRWLEAHGMYCTSHVWEEGLLLQAGAVGDFFKAQRAVSMPGNDCLVDKALYVHDFKETQSVCEFENRRFMSEILGVAGWQMSPILMKKAVNSITAWGVSHIVPHGIYMNRKLNTIPYPPDWYTPNPYWRYIDLWTDFARRASYVNSHGHLVPDVLLVNPMDSVCALLGDTFFDVNKPGESAASAGSHRRDIERIDKVYAQAINDLTDARIEYLIADRFYIRQMKIENNGRLVRQPFEFKAVVLPSMVVLPLDVAEKIVAFARAGGYVYLLGELPTGSTDKGMNDPDMKKLMDELTGMPTVKKASGGVAQLVGENAPFLKPQVVFETGAFPIIQIHRRLAGGDFFWLVNNTDATQKSTITFRDAGGLASVWDCETGEIAVVPSEDTAGGARTELSFKPYEAYWVVFDSNEKAVKPEKKAEESWVTVVSLDGKWNVRIDRSVQPMPAAPELAAPEELLSEQGIERELALWSQWDLNQFTGFVDYTKNFEMDGNGGVVALDLGDVKHTVEVWVNGQRVGCRLWPPFEFEIAKAVQKGRNTVKVRVGNLLFNAMMQYARAKDIKHQVWGWGKRPPQKSEYDAGLLGPVRVKRKQ
jgi:hypothetical protein